MGAFFVPQHRFQKPTRGTVTRMAAPKSKNPKSKFVTFRLTEDEDVDLGDLADDSGLSRSEVMRRAVRREIAAHKRRKKAGA